MLPSPCSREALVACPPSSSWKSSSFTVESTLSSPCSRSDPPLSRKGAIFAHLDSLPPHDRYFGLMALFVFLLAKVAVTYFPTASTEATVFFSEGPVCSSCSAEACAILHALYWSRQHQQVCHFSSLFFSPYLTLALSASLSPFLSSSPSFLLPKSLWQIWYFIFI